MTDSQAAEQATEKTGTDETAADATAGAAALPDTDPAPAAEAPDAVPAAVAADGVPPPGCLSRRGRVRTGIGGGTTVS
ncbi:hypothetical protein AB0885_13195, partial [Streptomyces sp. NPDC005534]